MRTSLLLLVLVVVMAGCKKEPAGDKPATPATAVSMRGPALSQEQIVAEIEKCGGKVERDGNASDGPVILVDLRDTKVTDAGLEHLSGLSHLQTLALVNTDVTDAGLGHLTELSNLRDLSLANTKVTDAGLDHLNGLHQLQTLELLNTKVTDAGLEHLKGLSRLQRLGLVNLKVTDQGVKKLQEALPKCKITR